MRIAGHLNGSGPFLGPETAGLPSADPGGSRPLGGARSTAGREGSVLAVTMTAREPMPAERVSMRRVREIVRLKYEGATERTIAGSIGVARTPSRAQALDRVAAARLGWPLPKTLSDWAMEALAWAAEFLRTCVGDGRVGRGTPGHGRPAAILDK